MGGGAMLPGVSGLGIGEAAAYCSSTITKSSTAGTTTTAEPPNSVAVISNHGPFSKKPSTGISCVCHENLDSPLGLDGGSRSGYEAVARKCWSDSVLGSPPSRLEVEKAMTELQRFLDGEAKSDFHWLQPMVSPSDSRMLQSPGYDRLHDAFNMLQREPSVQNMVSSISCDRAVWDAILNNLNNRAVQDLRGSTSAEERMLAAGEEADIANLSLKWILGFAKSKIVDLIEQIGLMIAELFLPGEKEKPTSELTDLLEEKIRSSLLLSIVLLLIVVVTRCNGT